MMQPMEDEEDIFDKMEVQDKQVEREFDRLEEEQQKLTTKSFQPVLNNKKFNALAEAIKKGQNYSVTGKIRAGWPVSGSSGFFATKQHLLVVALDAGSFIVAKAVLESYNSFSDTPHDKNALSENYNDKSLMSWVVVAEKLTTTQKIKLLDLLDSHGVNAEQRDRYFDASPVVVACLSGDASLLEWFANKKVNFSTTTSKKVNIFHIIASAEYKKEQLQDPLQMLQTTVARIQDEKGKTEAPKLIAQLINQESDNKTTPLMSIIGNNSLIQQQKIDIIEELFKAGLDIEKIAGKEKTTAFHLAAKTGQHEVLIVLLRYLAYQKQFSIFEADKRNISLQGIGANNYKNLDKEKRKILNHKDTDDHTPLTLSCRHCWVDCAVPLLEAGVEPDTDEQKPKRLPINEAIEGAVSLEQRYEDAPNEEVRNKCYRQSYTSVLEEFKCKNVGDLDKKDSLSRSPSFMAKSAQKFLGNEESKVFAFLFKGENALFPMTKLEKDITLDFVEMTKDFTNLFSSFGSSGGSSVSGNSSSNQSSSEKKKRNSQEK